MDGAGQSVNSICTDTSVPFGPCSAERSGATTSTTCPYYIWERKASLPGAHGNWDIRKDGSNFILPTSSKRTNINKVGGGGKTYFDGNQTNWKLPMTANTDLNSPNSLGRGENAVLRVRGPATVRVLALGPEKKWATGATKTDHLYLRLHGGRGGTKGEMLHGCDESITHCVNQGNPDPVAACSSGGTDGSL